MPLNEYRKKRDFKVSPEPSGEKAAPKAPKSSLIYVIQKHRASHLHYDFRLEYNGTLLSWAIPKGPSLDPSVKRLAMQVEDHPIDYNTFEGTIPKGEYGGGTVMLWDRGTYTADAATTPGEEEDAIRQGLARGDLKITFHGARLHGSFALIRMKFSRDGSSPSTPQWLLIKHRDESATSDDVVAEHLTSVESGRTMDEIASGKSRIWRSNRTSDNAAAESRSEKKVAATKSTPALSLGT